MKLTFQSLLEQLELNFQQGGWMFIGMGIISVILYSMLYASWTHLNSAKRQLADYLGSGSEDDKDIQREFHVFELEELAWVDRRFPVMKVLVAAAPLAGLLGTVGGMLATFAGLATADSTTPIDTISSGISHALLTTQLGLFIAIPAAIVLGLLRSQSLAVKESLHQRLHQSIIHQQLEVAVK